MTRWERFFVFSLRPGCAILSSGGVLLFFEEVFVMKKRYLRLAALTAGVLLAAQTGLSAAALSTFDAAYYAAQYKPFQNHAMPGRLCYLPGIAFFFLLL